VTTRVGIVGGSVAGLSLAVELHQRGIEAHVFERSSGLQAHEGAGLMMARPIMARLGLTDSRAVRRRFSLGPEGQVLWLQNVEKQAIGWSEVYGALRREASGVSLQEDCVVTQIGTDPPRITTTCLGTQAFDLVVGADGIGSMVRDRVDPGFCAKYLGYVAVRGLVPRQSLPSGMPGVIDSLFDDGMAKVLLADEHVTLYGLPGEKEPLNWMWYSNVPEHSLAELLAGTDGSIHRWSLPAGTMPAMTDQRLRTLAGQRLPNWLAALVAETDNLFLQPVYAGIAASMAVPGFALVGDAAHLAVPHVGGGVTLALQDTASLAEVIATPGSGQDQRLAAWQASRLAINAPRLDFAVRLGLSLQSAGKQWTAWNDSRFERWWVDLLQDAPDDASR